jgi:hypothetical protein
METDKTAPTPHEAAAALADAGSARDRFSRQLTVPSGFYPSIGIAIAIQIAALAVGVTAQTVLGVGLAVAGVIPLALVVAVQIVRFRRLNGATVEGLASKVGFGGDAAASTTHLLAMGLAIWAAFEQSWWLVAVCAVVGGVAYAAFGIRWMRAYRRDPAAHGHNSVLLMVVLAVPLLVAVVLLILKSTP